MLLLPLPLPPLPSSPLPGSIFGACAECPVGGAPQPGLVKGGPRGGEVGGGGGRISCGVEHGLVYQSVTNPTHTRHRQTDKQREREREVEGVREDNSYLEYLKGIPTPYLLSLTPSAVFTLWLLSKKRWRKMDKQVAPAW